MAPQFLKAQPHISVQLVITVAVPSGVPPRSRLSPGMRARKGASFGSLHTPARSSIVGSRSSKVVGVCARARSAFSSSAVSVPAGASIQKGTRTSGSNSVPVCPTEPFSRSCSP